MNANQIYQLYEQHKLYKGKKLKKFKDANEIKKHEYSDLLGQDEQIIFGFKALFDMYLFTDKAFYYKYEVTGDTEGIQESRPKRLAFENIIDWNVKEGYFYINGDKLDYGLFSFEKDKVILNLLIAIFDLVEKPTESSDIIKAKRKQVASETIFQIYQNNNLFDGRRQKYFREPQDLSEKALSKIYEQVETGEQIIFFIKKNFENYVFTDKAFYFQAQTRFAYEQLDTVKADLNEGKVFINDIETDLSKPSNGAEVQIVWALKNILLTLIDKTTEYSSFPALNFDNTISTSEGLFTKRFAGGINREDILYAARICRDVYADFPPTFEFPIIVYPNAADAQDDPFIGVLADEKLLFKYDLGQIGFYITDRHFGMYTNGKDSVAKMPLSEVESISVMNSFGKLYLRVNNNETLTLEIIAPCALSVAFMMMSLYTAADKKDDVCSLYEQFRRLRLIGDFEGIHTYISTSKTKEKIIEQQFAEKLTDEKYICWTNNRQLLLLRGDKIVFNQITDSGQLEQNKTGGRDNTAVDYVYVEVDNSKNRRGTGLAIGLLTGGIAGGLAGSMVGYGKKETGIEYSHCRLKYGYSSAQLYDMSPEEG